MQTNIKFIAHNGSVYVTHRRNSQLMNLVEEFADKGFTPAQAESVAKVLTIVHDEGFTTALNKVRARVDQIQVEEANEKTH